MTDEEWCVSTSVALETFLHKLASQPEVIEFEDTIGLIDSLYRFEPTAFDNGEQHNPAGQNNGSCKILAFGQLHGLSEAQTLACFGRFYRQDVLGNPAGTDHGNIRNFMRTGWAGVRFKGSPLTPRNQA